MRTTLDNCRKSSPDKNLRKEIVATSFILLFGVVLGIFAKWLDTLSVDDTIMWRHLLLGKIDLGNVFSRIGVWSLIATAIAVYSSRATRASINVFLFFIGMLIGYYVYTVTMVGFFPKTYIIAWSIITLFTPIAGFFTWYAKGVGWFSIFISAIIIGFFIVQAFSFGMWYLYIKYIAELIFLFIAILILLKKRIDFLYTLLGAFIAAHLIEMVLPYIFGGL